MKTVTNRTQAPLKLPLPRGKTLHLGPGKAGQIRDEDAEHPPLKKLSEAGSIGITDAQHQEGGGATGGSSSRGTGGGLGRSGVRHRQGDR
jgi:hypothetical protein